ncbi:hypothetical protein GCM10011518_38880 [Flavobacterium limi]|uniref:YD repeat-containing protein n=2 Tax=Flavobacterium limi TaxID=2045105 RepID=A0ABQ1UUY4_9FLAO|nr:hypothetical protein GCM10011518_38880 [Flavobacterium limi]
MINGFTPTYSIPNQYTNTCITYDSNIHGIVLEKITSSSGNYLEFVTSPNVRLDSESMANNQLDFIILKNSKNQQVKKFRFNYSYFEANNSKKIGGEFGTGIHCLNYRLRLDTFREIGLDGSEQSPYRFEYFGDNDPLTNDPYTLPYRLSPCQDHFGYYNNSYNQTIFPNNAENNPFRIDDWSLTSSGDYNGGGPSFAYGISNGGTREPDAEASKACVLNKIIFPTSGYTSFEFETHPINYDNWHYSWPIAGGLRVKKIETKEGPGSAPMIKNYEYPDYMSSEKCRAADNPYYTWYDTGFTESPPREGDWTALAAFGVPSHLSINNKFIVHVKGASQYRLGAGTNAVYTTVKEFSPGNGSCIYHFSFAPDLESGGWSDHDGVPTPGSFYSALVQTEDIYAYATRLPPHFDYKSISSCTFPFPNFVNNDWRRGHLLSKETYSENDVLLSQESTIYDIHALKAVPTYKVTSFGDEIAYYYARSYDIGGMAKPITQITKTYNSDGSYIEIKKEFDYNSTYHKQLTESREYTSKGDTIATKYYYPTEYGTSLSALKDKNILSPVDVRSYRNAKFISGKQVQYGVNGLPLTIYSAETKSTDIAFNPQSPYTFSNKLSNTYNLNNTLKSQTITDGITNVYLWGYNGQYPVAKIVNSDYATVSSIITQTQIDNAVTSGEIALRALLDTLRTSPLMKNTQITTYTYKPLVGMTSMTDEKGMTTYYEYDEFQRLKNVKDQQTNILSSNVYHYKQP